MELNTEKISNPQNYINSIALVIGLVGLGWSLGWLLIAPHLGFTSQMIYVYGTSAAMILSMFLFCVSLPVFCAFNVPIMTASLYTVINSENHFTWPFSVGLISLYVLVISIAKSFTKTFEQSVSVAFKNEKLYQELAIERDQSIAANLAKSRFIATASHDLRQPMHAINIYLESLDHSEMSHPLEKKISKIHQSVITLNEMFESLLSVSKLDAHSIKITQNQFHLNDLIIRLNSSFEQVADSKGLLLNFDAPDISIYGDESLLRQILSNLISNSIQYTSEGRVDVKFEMESKGLKVCVSDTGIGIAESEIALIFGEFYRIEKSRSVHDGLGLGLPIVQRITNLINAELRVESRLGQGSVFTVSTPYQENKDPVALIDDHKHLTKASVQDVLRGKVIAVIEDNHILLDAYRQTLAEKGAVVISIIDSGAELEKQLTSSSHIDCILSDYQLRNITGDAVLNQIRAYFKKDIPAIIVTADTSISHIQHFANLNIPVLHKPISFSEVIQNIETLLLTPQH
jgi:signal transduction histidine kinase/CheY-like chemotaxis protein